MTAKEKAEELVNKFYNEVRYYQRAKQCALIAVDEIRDNLPLITEIQQYWLDIKKEIEKL